MTKSGYTKPEHVLLAETDYCELVVKNEGKTELKKKDYDKELGSLYYRNVSHETT